MVKKKEVVNFSQTIEKLRSEKNIGYLDAIILYCEKTGMEIEVAAKSLSAGIKTKLKLEAEDLNLLKTPKTNRLPI